MGYFKDKRDRKRKEVEELLSYRETKPTRIDKHEVDATYTVKSFERIRVNGESMVSIVLTNAQATIEFEHGDYTWEVCSNYDISFITSEEIATKYFAGANKVILTSDVTGYAFHTADHRFNFRPSRYIIVPTKFKDSIRTPNDEEVYKGYKKILNEQIDIALDKYKFHLEDYLG